MRNRVGRRDKRVWFVVLGVFVTIFLFSFLVNRFKTMRENADAASLANFDPGYIISDYQMSNYNSMTEAEIQAFLTEKNPCGNTDYNYYLQLSANTNYKWHFEDGHFVCLSEELFGDGEVIGSGDTAAHIIWQAAQDYKINPQVLIVLIQKETALITDTIPNDGDYRKATGFGCPDTAACSSDYYGFKNQVRNAAKLFREVLDGGWTNYPIGNNYIQYNPNASCGGSVVNIQNLATSALYRYTPYQPNDAALTAGYGEAVCGAYGNRNFYLYFEDWFGGILEDSVKIPEVMQALIDSEEVILGSAESEIYFEPDGRIWQRFENGTIIYHADTGAHYVLHGAINTKWGDTGGSLGKLGKPTNDTVIESDGRIWQRFENGTIIYHADTGAWIVMDNAINSKWAIIGGSLGVLGTPINDQQENEKWIWQDFRNGGIIYNKQTNRDAISLQDDLIYQSWKKAVLEDESDVGVPISMQFIEQDGRHWQTFENGTIIYHADTGGYAVLNGPIHDIWASSGGSLGYYGRPIENKVEEGERMISQKFLNDSIIVTE